LKEEEMIATTETKSRETKLPRLLTQLPGPKAKQVLEQDAKFMSPSFTRDYPLVAKRGYGAVVEDVDGNTFLDFAAGIAVCSTGHCHPKVVEAIQKQAAELIHMSGTDFYYESLPQLAEKLVNTVPGADPKKAFFTNSGTEAIEGAMKLARYATKRDKFIAFYGGFHGRTMGALSLTGSKPQQRRRFSPLVGGVTHVPFPYPYRDNMHSTLSDEEYSLNCARYIEERIFKTIVAPEEVAAIFVEPIQGEGGYVVAPTNFMRELRAICNRHGILLVCDEVQSGAGRTGKWWAVEHTCVEPDIVTMAKGIASGMPLGICMSRAEIMNWLPGSHASTFGGNPLCLASAQATIEVLDSGGVANAGKVGEFMLERLRGWKQTHPLVGDVRGRGLMIGIELVKDKATREPITALRNRVETLAFEKGLLILGCGETSIRLCPPLIVSEQEATVALDILEDALSAAEKEYEQANEPAAVTA
jgi:4-aminobutyrate aminotransferase